MSEPFARTSRYLAADSGRLALAGAVLGLVLVVLWMLWLLVGRVPLQVPAREARSEADGSYSAKVDPTAAAGLSPGQHVEIASDTAAPIAATLSRVEASSGRVRLKLDAGAARPPGGSVWIVTERIAPAALIARMAAQSFTTR